MTSDADFGVPEFSLRNPSLPLLIAEAAMDIDDHMLGRSQEDASVKYLSQLIDGLTQGENPNVDDTAICEVLGYAVFGRKGDAEYWEGSQADELAVQVNLAAKELRDFKSLPESRQHELSSFCDRLCQETAHYHSNYHSRPIPFFHSELCGF